MSVNPQMLTLAREAAGLTQSALAHQVGVSQGLLSRIENGFDEPSRELLVRIGVACDVPADFFDQDDQVVGESLVDLFHKKRLTLPAKPLRKANAICNILRLQVRRLLRTIDLDDIAPVPVLADQPDLTPAIAAQIVRATWRISPGPLPNLVALLEAAAMPIFIADLGHEKLSAISMPGITGRHVIVVNEKLSPSARRFALAHELGHLVMHNGVASNDMERDADEFASALLMPRTDISPNLQGLKFRDLGRLKARWRVSLAALIRRAHDLGYISDRQYRSFNIQLNQLPGGRKNEPGEFEPERPRLIAHILRHYQESLGYSRSDLARMMVMSEDRLAEYYFGEPRRKVRPVAVERSLVRVASLAATDMGPT